jgi:galactitol-specific phosphotransferase system IIC component
VVLVLLGIWFVVKMVRMGSFRAFSAAFVIGTPLVGLGIIIVLLVRYKTGIAEFQRRTHESIFPFQPAPPTGAATESQSSP